MEELIFRLKQFDIKIDVVNDQLKLDLPEGFDASGILEEIRNNKQELITFIKGLKRTEFKGIEPAPLKDYYVLSAAQKRLYFLYEFNPESTAYNMPEVIKLNGTVDKDRIRQAFNNLIDRHEILRTTFVLIDQEPVQKINPSEDFKLTLYKADRSEIPSVVEKFIMPFDLNNGPLIRVGIIEIPTNDNVLLFDMHHIITDGVSRNILINEFKALLNNENLPDLALQYKDYAEWQQGEEQQQLISGQREFWLNQFAGEIPTLEMPIDFNRPSIKKHEGDFVTYELSDNQTQSLKSLAEKEKSTLFMVLLAVYNILLCKLCGQDDVVVGTPVAGRQHADLDNMIGMFVNMLPLRNYPTNTKSFSEFLSEIKIQTLSCFDNQSYPYEALIDELKIDRSTSRNPLFDNTFVFQNFEEVKLEVSDLMANSLENGHFVSKFDFTLAAIEKDKRISFELVYSTEIYKRETIERFATYLSNIINEVIDQPNRNIGDITVIPEKERFQLLDTFNSTQVEFPLGETIISLFEKQVNKYPENIAVKYNDELLSYNELNQQSDKMASYLQKNYLIKPGDLVGILLEREIVLIPIIMGILKAGAAYVPIDTKYPEDRINNILLDSKLSVLVSRNKYISEYSELKANVLDLDMSLTQIMAEKDKPVQVNITGDRLGYVIYTSGSTGKPKGVMIGQKSMVNFCYAFSGAFDSGFGPKDNCLSVSSLAFDVTIAEIFPPLIFGAKLVLADHNILSDPKLYTAKIYEESISFTYIPPSLLSHVSEEMGRYEQLLPLNKLMVGVEPIMGEVLDVFFNYNTDLDILNAYGPTEATVCSTFFKYTKEAVTGIIPIGKPIANTMCYILDKHNKIVPIGVPGELCVAGQSLAKEYLNNKELTDCKFVSNPLKEGDIIYKTGDLACWMPDGNIKFLGRIDNQVKIRGFRIELGEIESVLKDNEHVRKAIVLVHERSVDDKRLVAFVEFKNSIITTQELKSILANTIPDYMVPSLIVEVDTIPTNHNGKVNTAALIKELDNHQYNSDLYREPEGDIDKQVAEIWKTLLGIDKVGLDDTFFDLGGHSLLLIKFEQRIKELYNVELPFSLYFNATLEQISMEIFNKLNEPTVLVDSVPVEYQG